jgi:hypothetical protein
MPNADWDIDSDIRNVSGLLVKLEGLSDGGSQVVVWDRERKAWSAPDDPSVMSVADLMAAKPATERDLSTAGVPAPESGGEVLGKPD